MIKQLDTTEMPLAILMICSPGRSVSPVVLMAPATMPSPLPSLIIMAAKKSGLRIMAAAFSGVTPFSLRSS